MEFFQYRRMSGHTLLEVVISAAVLALVALFIMAGVSSSQTVSISSEDQLRASARVEQAMEAILALPHDQFLAEVASNGGASFSIEDMNLEDPDVGMFIVTPVPGTNNGVHEIRAIATFLGSSGRPGFRVELITRRSAE